MSSIPLSGIFYTPSLVVENITPNKDVRVMGVVVIAPGETIDVFKAVERYELREDDILYHLSKPYGDLYLEVEVKKSLVIHHIDLTGSHFSQVTPNNLSSNNTFSPGSWPVSVDGDTFTWVVPKAPLDIIGSELVLPPATSISDGYLTKEDYSLLFSSIGDQVIWQYQDFAAPVGTGISLTSFENGTGVNFNASYIKNNTASIVLASNTEVPPTSTTSIPAKYLSSSRVSVSSHIGTTVILNQAPAASLSVRVYYQISLPVGTKYPSGYIEDPNFVNERELDYLDDFYMNQAGDERIYDIKTFDSQAVFESSINIPLNPFDGYVLTSDSMGNGTWQPSTAGGGTNSHSLLSSLSNDDHLQYGLLSGSALRNTVTGTYNFKDGYLTLPVSLGTPPTDNLVDGSVVSSGGIVYIYDLVRGKWLSPNIITSSAARNQKNSSNIYLRTSDNVSSNIGPLVLPWDATLVGMSVSSGDVGSWVAEVHTNNSLVIGATISVTSASKGFDNSLNIDFNAGDALQIFMRGVGINRPRVNIFLSRRL